MLPAGTCHQIQAVKPLDIHLEDDCMAWRNVTNESFSVVSVWLQASNCLQSNPIFLFSLALGRAWESAMLVMEDGSFSFTYKCSKGSSTSNAQHPMHGLQPSCWRYFSYLLELQDGVGTLEGVYGILIPKLLLGAKLSQVACYKFGSKLYLQSASWYLWFGMGLDLRKTTGRVSPKTGPKLMNTPQVGLDWVLHFFPSQPDLNQPDHERVGLGRVIYSRAKLENTLK